MKAGGKSGQVFREARTQVKSGVRGNEGRGGRGKRGR